MRSPLHRRCRIERLALLVLVVIGGASGCTSTPRYDFDGAGGEAPAMPEHPAANPRALPMYAGRCGAPLRWPDLMRAAEWAEIIVIGEAHDDAVGHAVEAAVTRDVLTRWPGSAVSMEMLERDEQPIVDDYLDGIIDQSRFVRLTLSQNWAGKGSWDEWFQPIVNAAKEIGSRVIAANAPRRYVRLARTDGYARLRALPRDRRAFFHLPPRLPEGGYRDRFAQVMGAMSASDDEDVAAQHRIDPAHLESVFRSQMLWDATMAHSIIRANPSRSHKVVHVVGQFHSDFEGGTILELRRHWPWARILTISLQRRDGTTLHKDDRDRADIVIYTGERPPEEDADDETAALDEKDGDDAVGSTHDPHQMESADDPDEP